VGAPDDLVVQAIHALREIAVPPDVAKTAHEAASEIERTWQRSPLVAGFDGDVQARTELVNTLYGEKLLDPLARALGSAALRVRRGPHLLCRVLYSDRTRAVRTIPEPEPETDFSLGIRAEEVKGELATQETQHAEAERQLPVLVRQRPPAWAVWLWFWRVLLSLIHARTLATWRSAAESAAESRRKLATIEEYAAQRDQRERAAREKYFAELRAYASGGPAGEGIREVEIEMASALLPDGVELVEIAGTTRAGIAADALLVVARDGLHAPAPDGEPRRLGDVGEVMPQLPDLLRRARALTLTQRVRERLQAARAEIDVELSRAEVEFARRIARLDGFALPPDRAAFALAQVERMRPAITASTNAVMEHASVHLGSELSQLAAEWIGAIASSTSNDELKAAIAKIEEQWIPVPQRIAGEVRTLVMGGAAGVARDLYPEVVSSLRAHGLPEQYLQPLKQAPTIAAVPILPSLANPSAPNVGGSWIGGLFKPFDARKAEVREKVYARCEHLREVAAAEMLDAEPKLHRAIGQALSGQLSRAMEAQRDWHAKALAAEHAAIEADRRQLAPLVESRDAISTRDYQLGRSADALAADVPGISDAAVAAAS